ncbi:unnamed protein product [Prunus armeniaca]|uniref:Uncharacterized protein n=1 Tax=Prunus armeniaca TaxID=36596 RepID=A0A6J5WQW0_PRUAR|nr:unnamed protein product [Prunus armeniaca]
MLCTYPKKGRKKSLQHGTLTSIIRDLSRFFLPIPAASISSGRQGITDGFNDQNALPHGGACERGEKRNEGDCGEGRVVRLPKLLSPMKMICSGNGTSTVAARVPKRTEHDDVQQRVRAGHHADPQLALADDIAPHKKVGHGEAELLKGVEEQEDNLDQSHGETGGEDEGDGPEGIGGLFLDGDVDEEEEGDQEGGLEKPQGESHMDFAEVGLLEGGEGGEERVEVGAAEGGDTEELVEGPEDDEEDEEESDGPEGVEVLEMEGGAGLEAEVEDEAEGEEGEDDEGGDEEQGGKV